MSKPSRIRHVMRIDPDTHDYEFGFYLPSHPDELLGWFNVEQVVEAANAAVAAVTTREFNTIVAIEFPHYPAPDDAEP